MKVAEMNARQRMAFHNIVNAANWHIGGLENTLSDYPATSEEYKEAKAELADHKELVATLYNMAISDIYLEGGFSIGPAATKALKQIRFCGKEWLMERCERRVTKLGY